MLITYKWQVYDWEMQKLIFIKEAEFIIVLVKDKNLYLKINNNCN